VAPHAFSVTVELVASGEVSDYTPTVISSMRSIFATEAGVPIDDVSVSVLAASVRLTVTIAATDQTAATAVSTALAPVTATGAAATALLSTLPIMVSVSTVAVTIAASPPPPPSTPPLPPPTQPTVGASSSSGSLDGGAIAGIVVGSLVGVAALAALGYYLRSNAALKFKPTFVNTGEPRNITEVVMAPLSPPKSPKSDAQMYEAEGAPDSARDLPAIRRKASGEPALLARDLFGVTGAPAAAPAGTIRGAPAAAPAAAGPEGLKQVRV